MNKKCLNSATAISILQQRGLSLSDSLEVVAFILNKDYADVKGRHFDNLDKTLFLSIVDKIDRGMPIAYITGRKEFYGREFHVNEAVLIPRPETEVLVESVLDVIKLSGEQSLNILDLCTGSGCILLTLIKELDLFGIGVDISLDALDVARRNASRLNIDNSSFVFEHKDVLSMDIARYVIQKDIAIITANPPYISVMEYSNISNTLSFEPSLALIAEDDGLAFYKKLLNTIKELSTMIALGAYSRTFSNLYYFFEIGYNQKSSIETIAYDLGLEVYFKPDYLGHSRVLCGKL